MQALRFFRHFRGFVVGGSLRSRTPTRSRWIIFFGTFSASGLLKSGSIQLASLFFRVALLLYLVAFAGSLPAQDSDPERTAPDIVTPVTDRAIARGLKYLVSRQNEDGSFGTGDYRFNVAITGLAGMSLISSGSTPGRGPYGGHVNRCVNYILKNANENGFINVADQTRGPMYGHGFATLFLAEVYGMDVIY